MRISNFSKIKVQSLDIATLPGAEGPQQGRQGSKGPEGPPALPRSYKDGRVVPRSSSMQYCIKYAILTMLVGMLPQQP